MSTLRLVSSSSFLGILFGLVTVAPSAGAEDRPPHRTPPPEAFTACDGKSAGDACTVQFNGHTMNGTCRQPPPDASETRLVCAPAHHGGGDGGPPDGPPPGR